MRTIGILTAAMLFTLPGKNTTGATVSNSPLAGYTHIEVDQPAGWFTHAKGAGDLAFIEFEFQHFYSINEAVWITGSNGVGSLHAFDFSPSPTYVSVHVGPELGDGTQEFEYEYFYAPSTRLSQYVTLPIEQASLTAIPEPSTMLLGVLGLGLIYLKSRRLE